MSYSRGPWETALTPNLRYGKYNIGPEADPDHNIASADRLEDAILIAAAPDLLSAMEEILDLTKRKNEFSSEQSVRLLIQEIAEKAISKTKGK